jgi:hypothetical protein
MALVAARMLVKTEMSTNVMRGRWRAALTQ